ncbi:TetR/AcrR family transcriptional regulator [Rhodoluna sp.]|uniref:TetR/AcrR family transcriptional regulator n=1 Tax=Rhodoluna sp. TaxID=1969481 RepID=UPI0025CC1008|nr:TetR/AcrR family transcriptional regulator [Rhodoluna sp.]
MTPAKIVRDKRQEDILAAAQSLIATSGVDAVSMAGLAKATGLSRPAIYQYFASKEDVLAELVINEMADLSNAIEMHIAKLEDPLERIRIWIHYSLAHLASAEHRIIRQISIDSLPAEKRGMLNAMHGHFMMALLSPIGQLGVQDTTATAHLIYASVAASAKRIDEGSDFSREAAALEQFAIAGITASISAT